VVREVGKADMLQGIEARRASIAGSKPRIVSVEETPLGTQAIVRQRPKGAPPRDSTYLLRPEGRDWLIVYDGPLTDQLTATAVGSATQKAQTRSKSRSAQPSAAAQTAGAAAGTKAQEEVFDAIGIPTGARAREPAKSPRVALDRLWDSIRIGSPVGITAYDRKLVRRIGTNELLVAMHQGLRQQLQTAKLRVTDLEGTKIGTLAVVESKPPKAKATETSYLLKKRGDNWIVAYDGLLANNLVAAATRQAAERVMRKSARNTKQASPAAQRAGQQAGDRVRRKLSSLVPGLADRVAPEPPTG
jgi:hypothetical protein